MRPTAFRPCRLVREGPVLLGHPGDEQRLCDDAALESIEPHTLVGRVDLALRLLGGRCGRFASPSRPQAYSSQTQAHPHPWDSRQVHPRPHRQPARQAQSCPSRPRASPRPPSPRRCASSCRCTPRRRSAVRADGDVAAANRLGGHALEVDVIAFDGVGGQTPLGPEREYLRDGLEPLWRANRDLLATDLPGRARAVDLDVDDVCREEPGDGERTFAGERLGLAVASAAQEPAQRELMRGDASAHRRVALDAEVRDADAIPDTCIAVDRHRGRLHLAVERPLPVDRDRLRHHTPVRRARAVDGVAHAVDVSVDGARTVNGDAAVGPARQVAVAVDLDVSPGLVSHVRSSPTVSVR